MRNVIITLHARLSLMLGVLQHCEAELLNTAPGNSLVVILWLPALYQYADTKGTSVEYGVCNKH